MYALIIALVWTRYRFFNGTGDRCSNLGKKEYFDSLSCLASIKIRGRVSWEDRKIDMKKKRKKINGISIWLTELYVDRMFASCPGDRSSVTVRVIPKIQKMVLDASLLNTQHYKVIIKGNLSYPGKEIGPSPSP